MNQERQQEEQHLKECLHTIQENIASLETKELEYKEKVTELFQLVKQGEGDSYGQLLAGQNILEDTQNTLRKNRSALDKTYFARIDYDDLTFETSECCYIGKNGIMKNQSDIIIVDWRAPIATVYYENELGDGCYDVPDSDRISIHLHKKRTYDIANGVLLGYYDDDVASTDELLIKYLSQNKEAVLSDIIATIQKEQNAIIRQVPYKNMIVQGVAGSGKTTVALHRISYLLYNYENRYKPSEFCIIGSTDMLLHYISSGLPELDVHNVQQMRMDQFLSYLINKAWKKNFKIIQDTPDAPYKSKLFFIKKLEQFLQNWKTTYLPLEEVYDDEIGVILSKESFQETLTNNPLLSLFQLEKLLNNKLAMRIKFLCSEQSDSYKKDKLTQYKKYFHSEQHKWKEQLLYMQFLEWMTNTENIALTETKLNVQKNQFDLYDCAALALIHQKIFIKKEQDEFSQIILDEAQDFGEMIYYVLKQVLPHCYFTIMGDVSQNIRYETGLNDWNGVKEALFDKEEDSFYLLSKSYRNTIEISECAGKVLEKTSQENYKIQPVIRHGKPVQFHQISSEQLMPTLFHTITQLEEKNFETIAIICRNEEEVQQLKEALGIPTDADSDFHNGIMVLPVTLTKGLEFDAVILWNADEEHYSNTQKEAKLLYVAITRALHELHVITDKNISSLFL